MVISLLAGCFHDALSYMRAGWIDMTGTSPSKKAEAYERLGKPGDLAFAAYWHGQAGNRARARELLAHVSRHQAEMFSQGGLYEQHAFYYAMHNTKL
jgi:hypothetical protein